MSRTRRRRRGKPTPSLLAVLRQGFEYEMFLDLHDHLYEAFERPGVILTIRDAIDYGLRACFPRRRSPTPAEFFHYVTQLTARSRSATIIEQTEIEIATSLLERERKGGSNPWGWHASKRGVVDLYLPIRTTSGYGRVDNIAGVLVFGKYRVRRSSARRALHDWVDQLVADPSAALADTPKSQRQEIVDELHRLADGVPVADECTRERVEYEVRRALALTQRFLTRTLASGLLFAGEDLIDQLTADEPALGLSLSDLWRTLEGNLTKVVKALPLQAAGAFVASERDTSEFQLKSMVGMAPESNSTLAFPDDDEFRWLEGQSWVNVPRSDGPMSWFNPRVNLSADHGILFAREFSAGHLVLLCFGSDKRLAPSERTTLYDAVTSRLFPFIDSALAAIELDDLMAETGHLMGRAVGKVQSGFEVLSEVLPRTLPDLTQEKKYRLACWAIEDGANRLDLIRQNFYAFAGQRRHVDVDEVFDPAFSETFDVVEMLEEMRAFFDRASREAELRTVHYRVPKFPVFVTGHPESLRLAFLNLFDNAMKFAYQNTFVRIAVTRTSEDTLIVFENLGVGVAPDETHRVFRRLRKSRFRDPSRRIEGLGLGLPYCRRVVELIFKGEISLRSWEAETPQPRRFAGDNWLTEVTLRIPLSKDSGRKEDPSDR